MFLLFVLGTVAADNSFTVRFDVTLAPGEKGHFDVEVFPGRSSIFFRQYCVSNVSINQIKSGHL